MRKTVVVIETGVPVRAVGTVTDTGRGVAPEIPRRLTDTATRTMAIVIGTTGGAPTGAVIARKEAAVVLGNVNTRRRTTASNAL